MTKSPTLTPTEKTILDRADSGETVKSIAKAIDMSPGHIYSVLRERRPRRKRTPRERTSSVPTDVERLTREGMKPAEIAAELGVTRQYVYKALPDLSDMPRMIRGLAKQGIKPHRIAVVLGLGREYVDRYLSR